MRAGIFLALCALTAPAAFAEAASTKYPMRRVANMFDPLSRPAEMIHESAVLVLLISAGIFIVVGGALTYILIKFRHRADDNGHEPPQIYGSTHIEMAWTVIPILIIVVLVLVASRTIGEIQNMKMPPNAINVTAIGHQWWWEFRYPDLGIVTANELHVPVSTRDIATATPTDLLLQSVDVVHSFWVPQLAGKTDLIPNRSNKLWIEPYKTGVYFGNCAEYCGTQHANMQIRVIVHTPEDFKKWVAQQKAPVPAPQTPEEIKGHALFYKYSCVSCHTIDGTVAEGVFGPDLTKLMTRETIGAGVAPLTTATLRAWMKNPQDLKPGCHMPDMQLHKPEVDAIVAYLETLK